MGSQHASEIYSDFRFIYVMSKFGQQAKNGI